MEENINRVDGYGRAHLRGNVPDGSSADVYKKSAVLDQLSRTQEVRIRLDNPIFFLNTACSQPSSWFWGPEPAYPRYPWTRL